MPTMTQVPETTLANVSSQMQTIGDNLQRACTDAIVRNADGNGDANVANALRAIQVRIDGLRSTGADAVLNDQDSFEDWSSNAKELWDAIVYQDTQVQSWPFTAIVQQTISQSVVDVGHAAGNAVNTVKSVASGALPILFVAMVCLLALAFITR